jgi:hypothetical protein
MKKPLIAALVFFGSCKSTDSIKQFAKSAGTGISEINSLPAGPATQPLNYRQKYSEADSLSRLIWYTLINYFRLLQAYSDQKQLPYNTKDLVNSLEAMQTKTYHYKYTSDETLTAVRSLLNTILNEPIKNHRYKQLVKIMKQNDFSLGLLISDCDFILDSSLAGDLKMQTSKRILKLARKDHYMLAFGTPPTGFAYTSQEISQDIVLINKMTANLRSEHPDANE